MGARAKLNQAHFNGALVISGIIAAVFESWTLFAVLAVTLMIAALAGGDILACSPKADPDVMRVSTALSGKETFDGKEKEAAQPRADHP